MEKSNNDDFNRNLYCNICQEILRSPKECTECQYNFCKKCIEDWFRIKQKCPFRCNKLSIIPSQKILLENLNKLKFKCKECQLEYKYKDYDSHLKNCEFNLCECPNDKCKIKLIAREISKHTEKDCNFQEHECRLCGYKIVAAQHLFLKHDCNYHATLEFHNLRSRINICISKFKSRIDTIDKVCEMIDKYDR